MERKNLNWKYSKTETNLNHTACELASAAGNTVVGLYYM